MALVGVSGCNNEPLAGGGKKPLDGSVPATEAGDPAACGCQVDGYTLTISWDCYCAEYDCTQTQNFTNQCYGGNSIWTQGCGFRQISVMTIGGPEEWVYTDSGQLIGAQLGTDTADFTCPTDPSLHGFALRAGKFPLDSCEAQTPCPCVDGGVSCSTPPLPDAGTDSLPRLPPVDAAI